MSQERILTMLEQGTITTDEATRLLEAISTAEEREDSEDIHSPSEAPAVERGEPVALGLEPNARKWRIIQQIPLVVSLAILILTGWGLYAIYRHAGARITFGWVALFAVFLLACLATVLSVWMVSAPWMHVRIRESDGRRIAISLPVPLTLAAWATRFARQYVDQETAGYLDASREFLRTMDKDRRDALPITVDVDEGDHQVQVYIG